MSNTNHCHKMPVPQIPTARKIDDEVMCQFLDRHPVPSNLVSWGTRGLTYIWYIFPTMFGVCAPSSGWSTMPVPLKTKHCYDIGICGSVLLLICHVHKCTIKSTTVHIFKRLGSVRWSETYNGTAVLLVRTLWLKSSLVYQATGIFIHPACGAQAPKRVGDTHQMYVYNRYSSFSWYEKWVWCHTKCTE